MRENNVSFIIPNEIRMEKLGAILSHLCFDGTVIYLQGDLGVGKTTLTRGFLRGLGYTGLVKSPTYTLVETYEIHEKIIYHFDLYRLLDPEELDYIGIRDYVSGRAICLIEWPEKGKTYLPEPDLICMIYPHLQGREIMFKGNSQIGINIIRQLNDESI